jgi:N-acetylglutamate synthase-like GNAT family acetyltransferase
MRVRRPTAKDRRAVWALNSIPNIGKTGDPSWPLEMPLPDDPPAAFPDLADVPASFTDVGGEFLVVESRGRLVGMGGVRPTSTNSAEVLRVRVHPATRRRGIGTLLMSSLEDRARQLGIGRLHLDTATNQPEAVAFYRALGYEEVGTESRPDWTWTLIYFGKDLTPPPDTR